MTDGFVTPRMSAWLDLIRAVAALAVLLGHSVQVTGYRGYYPFSIALQQNAVIVFFVLSGLLIADSAERAPSLRSYTIARVARILPVSVAAVVLSILVGAMDAGVDANPLSPPDASWSDPKTGLGALLFLSEGYWPSFQLNPPYWSLCYEVWFYALFGAAAFLKGRSQALWLALLCLAAGPRVLLLLPCWLLGVALKRRGTGLPLKWARIAVALSFAALAVAPHIAPPLFGVLASVAPRNLGYSLYALSDTLLASCIAFGLMGLRTLAEHGIAFPGRWQPSVRHLANMSFSLYVIHWPVLKLLCLVGMNVGSNPLKLGLAMITVIAAAAGFAELTEHRRPAVRAWLERRFGQRALIAG